ncbi:MAG: alanine--tRNA ligase [Acidimicrobiales bacterium mtb01]|nr:alanine--tRNA ligase [Actinomycetota bacterium]TEX45960.1 MAG: alanine--tRNA ligase [Acidimicrobiales bacterium mtb01]
MTRRPPRTADELRQAFTDFFVSKSHTAVPSASLIPHDPTVLFTVAGMVPFKPYFVGDEIAPFKRAATVQKCVRAGGKHNDLDDVGRTKRHLVFFEMLGNFSFGDYFKESAIPWSWELVTEHLGFDGDRIWVTVHTSDDEAEAIWHEQVGVPLDRIQRLGDKDNFWQMGDTGPCGPCSELHIDRGPAFGPDGGPLNDPHGDRFMEFWNLVFMQFNQAPDGSRTPLPKPSIDTGAGLERILALVQGTDSVWETDALFPMIEQAQSLTGARYLTGDYDDRASFSLRVLAEHARSSAMLVGDGVFPSNEGRGYVLRRIIRRAVRHAYLLGTEKLVMPDLVRTAVDVMGHAYPDLVSQRDFVVDVLTREEERFRQTLKTGVAILDGEIARSAGRLAGETAFLLHDTYGFPLEVTEEIVGERGLTVDREGFDREMTSQRERAKAARKGAGVAAELQDRYREILEEFGTTNFVGYTSDESAARVLAVIETDDGLDVFLDRTPFYAESGGQVGDTGRIEGSSGVLEVLDTTFAVPGLRRHHCRLVSGEVSIGQLVTAIIDSDRRASIRRHHTGTHILHWALREVLGDHVKQAGSLVDDHRLRFDFNHFAALSADEIARIEELANHETLVNTAVTAYETSKEEALAKGAIAFFGDKYGDTVRVLQAGPSVELCGGTHVSATGDIGIIKIVSEGSIGANLRRIEAVAGDRSLGLLQKQESTLGTIAELVGTDVVVEGVNRKLAELKAALDEIKTLKARAARGRATEFATAASNGVVVERVDGLAPDELRDLALAVRAVAGIRRVVLGGLTPAGGVSLVAAVASGEGAAGDLIRDAAKAVGGGGGGKGDVATAGGKNPQGLDEALRIATEVARP